MKNKITQAVPFLITLLGIESAPVSYWCIYSNGYCYSTWIHHIYPYFTNPLYNFSIFFLIVAIILIFVQHSVFKSWLKFAAWAIPLAIILVALTPVNSNAFMDFFPFYRDDAARLAGEVFSGLSLLLIVWKSIAIRNTTKKV